MSKNNEVMSEIEKIRFNTINDTFNKVAQTFSELAAKLSEDKGQPIVTNLSSNINKALKGYDKTATVNFSEATILHNQGVLATVTKEAMKIIMQKVTPEYAKLKEEIVNIAISGKRIIREIDNKELHTAFDKDATRLRAAVSELIMEKQVVGAFSALAEQVENKGRKRFDQLSTDIKTQVAAYNKAEDSEQQKAALDKLSFLATKFNMDHPSKGKDGISKKILDVGQAAAEWRGNHEDAKAQTAFTNAATELSDMKIKKTKAQMLRDGVKKIRNVVLGEKKVDNQARREEKVKGVGRQ